MLIFEEGGKPENREVVRSNKAGNEAGIALGLSQGCGISVESRGNELRERNLYI